MQFYFVIYINDIFAHLILIAFWCYLLLLFIMIGNHEASEKQ